MKRYAAQALAVTGFVAVAGAAFGQTSDEQLLQCENEGLAAQSIMLMRQQGDTAEKIRSMAIPVAGFDLAPVIAAAMAEPVADGSAGRLRAGEKFKTRYKVACLVRKD